MRMIEEKLSELAPSISWDASSEDYTDGVLRCLLWVLQEMLEHSVLINTYPDGEINIGDHQIDWDSCFPNYEVIGLDLRETIVDFALEILKAKEKGLL